MSSHGIWADLIGDLIEKWLGLNAHDLPIPTTVRTHLKIRAGPPTGASGQSKMPK